jgi:DNA mismatch repair ATPase MutS
MAMLLDRWRQTSGPAFAGWLAALGEIEALCALAAYSYECPDDPFPEITEGGTVFVAEGLGHPLLPRARCVRNDLSLGDGVRVLIVSGSNMAGKSTLLRAAGVNAVLALAGATVRARRLRLSPLAVGATLRVQDSLQAGKSRFYAEVLRVRRLLGMARGEPPLLFLLDELFQGTSSTDRRAGAEAVVRQLAGAGAIGLVTTHDLALTEIAERLGGQAANVHFEDAFADGEITFDYRMRPGVVRHTNGLALLRAVGIEV